MNVREAKKYYPLFGIGANVALLFAGQVGCLSSVGVGLLAVGVGCWRFV